MMKNICCPMPKKIKIKIEKKRTIIDKTTEVLANEEIKITHSKNHLKHVLFGLVFTVVLMLGVGLINRQLGFFNEPLLYLVQSVLVALSFYFSVKFAMMSADHLSEGIILFKINSVLIKNPPYKQTEFTVLKEYRVLSIGLETYLLEDVNGELLEVGHMQAFNLYKEKVAE